MLKSSLCLHILSFQIQCSESYFDSEHKNSFSISKDVQSSSVMFAHSRSSQYKASRSSAKALLCRTETYRSTSAFQTRNNFLMTFMKEIPDEILDLILVFAVRGHQDMRTLALTCKRWLSFVQQDIAWKRLSIRGWGNRADIVLIPIEKDASISWFRYYQERILSHLPERSYMKSQQHLTVSIRAILINWLLAVVDEFQQQQSNEAMRLPLAHHQTVALFDSYCSNLPAIIQTSELQTIGAACAVLALHPDQGPDSIERACFDKASFYTDGACTGEEILRAARRIAEVLRLRPGSLPADTACVHIDRLLSAMQKNYPASSTHCLSHYLGELALQAEASLRFDAATLGAAAYALACHTLGWPEAVWMPVVRARSAFSELRPLQRCMAELQGLLRQALAMLTRKGRRGNLPHVVVKYSRRERQHVAKVIVTPLPWPATCPHGENRCGIGGSGETAEEPCELCAAEAAAATADREQDQGAGELEDEAAVIPPPEDTMDAGVGFDRPGAGAATADGDGGFHLAHGAHHAAGLPADDEDGAHTPSAAAFSGESPGSPTAPCLLRGVPRTARPSALLNPRPADMAREDCAACGGFSLDGELLDAGGGSDASDVCSSGGMQEEED